MYVPGESRVGEATPQTDPGLFSKDELLSEVKYLLRMNKRYGPHPLRGQAIARLEAAIALR